MKTLDISWLTSVFTLASETSRQWGLGVVLLVVALWFVRVDILVPIVAAHKDFLGHVVEEISENNALQRENNTLHHENNALLRDILRRTAGEHVARD